MASATLEKPPSSGPEEGFQAVWEDRITGRFRKITTHQLCMAWWLYEAGHISRRQLRIYFAAHEMTERREYVDGHALYSIEEVKNLVGGRGSKTATAELSADVKRLGRLGLVKLGRHTIEFALSIEQIALEDVAGFWTLFNRMPNDRRVVPVPRRTLRALAAGFGRAVTAVMIATMIRSLYWHKKDNAYRVDGRTKGSWIAEVFGVSRKAVSNARTRLTELGWIEPVQSPQWQLNKWGAHDRINTDWSPANDQLATVENGAGDQPDDTGKTASPPADFPGGTASPDLNKSPSSIEEDLITRRPSHAPEARRQTRMVSKEKKAIRGCVRSGQPSLRNIQTEDLADTQTVMVLYGEAKAQGLAGSGEGGLLEFMAMVERARAHGTNPGGLLTWLLQKQRFEFVTLADEDRAATRLREHRDGPTLRSTEGPSFDRELSEDDLVVRRCILTAKQHRGITPFRVAQQVKGWTREQWEAAHMRYEAAERQRWM